MSTQTIAAAGVREPAADIHRVPFARLVRVELRKSYNTRAGFWLLTTIGVVTAAAIVIFLFVGKPADLTYANFLAAAGIPQSIFLPVLGILLITSEWSQRTGLVTFTLEPKRPRIIAAKVLAAVVLGLVAVFVAFAVAALVNLVGMGVRNGDGSWAFGLGGFGDIVLLQLLGILGGLAYGMVLLNSAAAIVLSFALPTVFGIVFSWSKVASWAPWIDPSTAQDPLTSQSMASTSDAWAHLTVNTLIWVVIPIVVGVWRLLRSEVKSA
jgi:ABC-type transport system involved in multi-copper enzyme maturation permease subunit